MHVVFLRREKMKSEKQFDGIYPVKPEKHLNPGRDKKKKFIEDDQIRRQRETSDRPSNIVYFEEIICGGYTEKKRPRVGVFCNMIPVEIIRALGADAVRLDCGNNALAQTGEEVFSGEICPLAKSSFGSFLETQSLSQSCDCVILPSSCDAKRKMGEALSDFLPVFILNLPPEQNYSRFSKMANDETERMISFLESTLNVKLSNSKLAEEIAVSVRKTELVRQIHDLRRKNPRLLLPSDLFMIIQSSLFRPVDQAEWIDEVMKTIAEMTIRITDSKNLRPRIVLTGAPMVWPNFKVLHLLEECGADIVADTLCTGGQSLYDPVVADESNRRSMIRSLVNKYIFASVCPCFLSQTSRINRVIDLVDTMKADGVINYSLRLCQLFDMENYRLDKTLKGRGVPYMNIRSDYSLEDTEQLRVRIEAFLETV
jgi:benzoyl-CoA reductase/2-hydroxyglutaryl-CoA dehydratase subunit BcrC/BadD/HgdB